MATLAQHHQSQKGFTLLEISVALVIISLVVGGIILGSSMIYASQIRGAQSEIAKMNTAVTLFKAKMGGLPGDLKTASQFWSTATNGNGNVRIDSNADGSMSEEYYVWQHLSSAQLINGVHTASGTTDIPTSAISGGYYRLSYKTDVYQTTSHLISLNAMDTTYNTAHNALMSPKDVYAMDVKSDDGKADSGAIMGFNVEGVPGCVTNDYTVGSGDYLTTSEDIKCKVFFESAL